MGEMNFFEKLKKGLCKPKDLDEYVDQWHDGNGFGVELWEYLGMNFKQYKFFIENQFEPLDNYYGIDKNNKTFPKK